MVNRKTLLRAEEILVFPGYLEGSIRRSEDVTLILSKESENTLI